MLLALSVGCGRLGFETLELPPMNGGTGGFSGGGPQQTAGGGEQQTAGTAGQQAAGGGGQQTAGSAGQLTAGGGGQQTAGSAGQLTAGSGGQLTAGSGGQLTAGSAGQLTAGSGGQLTAGSGGQLTAGSAGQLTTGGGGQLTAGNGGQPTAGSGGGAGAPPLGGSAGMAGSPGTAGAGTAGDGGAGGVPAAPSCTDGIQNQDENGVDCGGITCPLCPGCTYEPWGAPEVISGLGLSGQAWGPALSADARTLLLSAYGTDNEDLFTATSSDRGTTFSAALPLDEVNDAANDATPFLSSDDLTLYFASERSGGLGNRDLYLATRSSLASPFEPAVWLQALNSDQNDHLPALTPDDLLLVFVSSRSGGVGNADLWVAERSARTDPFSPPFNLTEINTGQRETGPSLSADALTLYFSSNRTGGVGDHDLWVSVRADRGAPFDAPQNLTNLNSTAADLDACISSDGRELFFASERNGGSEIWRAWRDCRP